MTCEKNITTGISRECCEIKLFCKWKEQVDNITTCTDDLSNDDVDGDHVIIKAVRLTSALYGRALLLQYQLGSALTSQSFASDPVLTQEGKFAWE
jgi:hypothetical protein